MNRLEVLIEALKECNRHIEELTRIERASTRLTGFLDLQLANRQSDEIARAILCDKDQDKPGMDSLKAQNDLIAGECERLEAENQKLYAELDNAKKELELSRAVNFLTKPNPALENVLAKLRAIVPNCSGFADSYLIADSVTLGDLRRWVESEVKK